MYVYIYIYTRILNTCLSIYYIDHMDIKPIQSILNKQYLYIYIYTHIYICSPPRPIYIHICLCNRYVSETYLVTHCSTASGKYLQIACRDYLVNTKQQFQAKGTGLLVARVQSGEIFSHVSFPHFNPHKIEINKRR